APRFTPSTLNCTPRTPTLSVALAETVTVPVTESPATGAVMETAGGVVSGTGLLTVTLTAAEVATLPAASRATAVTLCTPLLAVVLFHERVYGAVVTSAPRFVLSSLNCTPAMAPPLSEAVAETATAVPETMALLDGALIETVGVAGVIVTARVWVPVPPALVALRVIVEAPAVVGVPEMSPVVPLSARLAGNPVAPKLVGLFVAVIG